MLQAVIDIGSNSVRLVIYDGLMRAPIAICNEKSLCGLGRDMTPEGDLNPDSMELALKTLRRFKLILNSHGNPEVNVIATAAVREARNGKEFSNRVRKLGYEMTVIPGNEEARLAALGVVSQEPNAKGVVGDMGGGSLELIAVDGSSIKSRDSLSIGPLRVMQRSKGDLALATKLIEKEVKSLEWLKSKEHEVLYAVGGAWRAVARIHMRLRSHPVSVLHHYELTSTQVIEICDLIARQSRNSLEEIPGIPKRRLDTLPYAAIVLRSVLQQMKAEKMIVSSSGVREGLLYDQLSDDIKKTDPLMAGVSFFASRLSPNPAVGDVVGKMTDKLFEDETSREKRIRRAACRMMDVGAYFHPDLRGFQAFDTAWRAPFYGVTHPERVALALSLFVRHEGRRAVWPDEQAIGLLRWEEQQRALKIGLAMRFAGAFSPKVTGPLEKCKLLLRDGKLIFDAPADREPMMEEVPLRRLESLASAFEAEVAFNYT